MLIYANPNTITFCEVVTLMKKLLLLIIILLSSCSCSHADTHARFLFIGDIMTHQQQLDAAHRNGTYDFSPQFRRVKPLLVDSFLVGNLETVFAGTNKKLRYSGYPLFNTPDVLTDTLNALSIDLLTLANNHIFDRGAEGARRTTKVLDSADIAWVGLGLDNIPSNDAVLLINNGIRAAFVNHSYGSNLWPRGTTGGNIKQKFPASSHDVHLNTTDDASITHSLERAKALSPDVIIACFHWGYEYHYTPSTYQQKAADTAFMNGATLIVGTHPHVLQPVEIRNVSGDFRAVAWSLGNFVSFQRTLPRERSYILSAEFVKSDDGHTRLVKLGAAPLYVIAPGSKRTEVTYAGTHEPTIASLDFTGLSKSQIANTQSIGRAVIEFLGAQDTVDEYGFYTLWDETSADVLPISRRKSPLNAQTRRKTK